MKKVKKISRRKPAALDKQQTNAEVSSARAIRRIETKPSPPSQKNRSICLLRFVKGALRRLSADM